jgi:hypothetical protein
MNRRWRVGYSRWGILVVGRASEIGQSVGRVFHNTVVGRQRVRRLGSEWTLEGCGSWSGRIRMMAA